MGKDPQCFCEEGENAIDEEDAVTSTMKRVFLYANHAANTWWFLHILKGATLLDTAVTFVKAVRLKGCVMVPESVGIAQHHTHFCFNCWPKERAMRVRSEDIALKAREGVTCMMKVLYSSTQSMPKWFILKALEKRMYPIFLPELFEMKSMNRSRRLLMLRMGRKKTKMQMFLPVKKTRTTKSMEIVILVLLALPRIVFRLKTMRQESNPQSRRETLHLYQAHLNSKIW